MIVARQFIAWNIPKKGASPVGTIDCEVDRLMYLGDFRAPRSGSLGPGSDGAYWSFSRLRLNSRPKMASNENQPGPKQRMISAAKKNGKGAALTNLSG